MNDHSYRKNSAQYYICVKIFFLKICRCFFSFLIAGELEKTLFISTLFFCLAVFHPFVFGCSWLSLQRLFWSGRQCQSGGTWDGLWHLLFSLCLIVFLALWHEFMIGLFKTLLLFYFFTWISISVTFFFSPPPVIIILMCWMCLFKNVFL